MVPCFRYALAIGLLVVLVRAQSIIDLSKSRWTLSNEALGISVPGYLPSHVHLDLYAANVIGNPLHGLNDFTQRWIAWSNWTYTSDPIPITKGPTASNTYLVFQGLDTFTSISFCGQHIASTDNQFRQHFFEISEALQRCPEEPRLSINFGSAPNIVDAIAEQRGQRTWPFGVQQTFEFPNRWFMRKQQSDFGWDWGPSFAPAGPWQPAYVVQLAVNSLYVRNSLIDVYRQGQKNNKPPDQTQPWVVNASVDFLGELPANALLTYEIRGDDNDVVVEGFVSNVAVTDVAIGGSFVVPSEAVTLWWPNGFGRQTLYELTIDILTRDLASLASVKKRIGFRTIVLNQEEVTKEELAKGIAPGDHWHFEINGHEFFAKGSNLIPPEVFWPSVTVEQIRQLLESAIESKQNMLRIWSSGAYSPAFFYDLADEMGILLWSEFEFGDALYPVDDNFLDNVYEEVNYQVRRVNHHPSLAFWAGGNELENLEFSLVNQSVPELYVELKAEYEKLFLETIVPAVFGNTRSISYAPSSTSNGYTSISYEKSPYFTQRYQNLKQGSFYGETDFYNYNPEVAFHYEGYPVGRFSNEFGYHSLPSLQTWQQAVLPRDLHFNSSVIQLRNHHYPSGSTDTRNYRNSSLGMGEMTRAVELYYPTPSKHDPIANFSSWCHATQIFQADYYVSQINFYRRGSGLPQRTLGSLYWQLNDQWQAPTWSSIEYDGRWKALHYRVKDAYSNVVVAPFYNTSIHTLEAWVISDLWAPVKGVVNGRWYNWRGDLVRVVEDIWVEVGAINSTRVFSKDVQHWLSPHSLEDLVLELRVIVSGHLPDSETTRMFRHTTWVHPAPLSSARLVDPGLVLEYWTSTKQFLVQATTGVAAWVWLDYPAGAVVTFEDNGFWLMKGQRRMIGYTVKTGAVGGDWASRVTVSSMWNQTLAV